MSKGKKSRRDGGSKQGEAGVGGAAASVGDEGAPEGTITEAATAPLAGATGSSDPALMYATRKNGDSGAHTPVAAASTADVAPATPVADAPAHAPDQPLRGQPAQRRAHPN